MQAELGSHVGDSAVPVHYAYVARYTYSDVVVQNDNFLRLSAYSDHRQWVESRDIQTNPDGKKVAYSDRFGNVVHRVRIMAPHQELTIASIGEVYLEPAAPPVADMSLSSIEHRLDALEFLAPSPLVDPDTVADAAKTVAGDSGTLLELIHRVVAWVWEEIIYQRGNTSVNTTAADVLASKEGVCQDKTHLALAMIRSLGVPARYVSGLLTRQAGETHAWMEFLHPKAGWLPADPTRGIVIEIGTDYLKLGVGRDYSEVPPVTGSFISRGSGHLDFATAQVYFDRETISFEDALSLIETNYPWKEVQDRW